jgi:hypothetical protein
LLTVTKKVLYLYYQNETNNIKTMKTTKSTVLAKKIEKLVANKELNKNSLVYGWINSITNGEKEFRPVFTQGSTWKHSSLIDKTNELEAILRKLNISFSTSNDAPRGGKTGVRIDINTKIIL